MQIIHNESTALPKSEKSAAKSDRETIHTFGVYQRSCEPLGLCGHLMPVSVEPQYLHLLLPLP